MTLSNNVDFKLSMRACLKSKETHVSLTTTSTVNTELPLKYKCPHVLQRNFKTKKEILKKKSGKKMAKENNRFLDDPVKKYLAMRF